MAHKRVALAGKGRVGSSVLDELIKAGFTTSVLTRSAANISNIPAGVQIIEVDYDSEDSLEHALKGHDALVSMVAMSAIANQPKMIDAAIKAGVKFFVPAECSMSTRDPKAQWLPVYSSVLPIQQYLEERRDKIDWAVVACGALVEFVLDYPVLLDFDNRVATLYDGGDQGLSLSTCQIAAKAIAGFLQQPERIRNHVVKVHGGILTQNEALKIAQKYSDKEWTIQHRDSGDEIKSSMKMIQNGAGGDALLTALMSTTAAAIFGKEPIEAAYKEPDNDWLGIDLFDDGFVEDEIRKRVEIGPHSVQSSTTNAEGMADIAQSLVS